MPHLAMEWDKVYPKDESVNHKKVTFKNHFGIELAADMFLPKERKGKLPAIACCGVFCAVKEQHSGLYAQYYRTSRGYHKRSLNSNNGWNITADTSLMNTRLLTYASEIRSAVLLVHGEKAHSKYMSEDAFKLLKGNNKELFIVPDATHCDLYDGGEKIIFRLIKLKNLSEKI